ncbi:MAG: Gfo/Idh/MocA family oxidoreductase [Actinomycetota bacterium]
MDNFRWGIMGTGGIAKAFAKDLQLAPGHVVAAVGSRSLTTAEEFASPYPGCTPHGSYESLVNDPNVDAIYIATLNPYHSPNALLAISAGKPVLCEKPFALNAREASEMIEAARKSNLALVEAMWTRFLPHIHQLRKILSSGVLGEIICVEADHGQALEERNIPRLALLENGGGGLIDLGVYPISFAHLVLGAPKKISASALFSNEGVDSQTSAIFDYESGAQAIVSSNMRGRTPCRAVISGTLARVEIDRTFYRPTTMRVVTKDEVVTEYPNNYEGHGLREQAIEFARVVRAGEMESPLLTWDETLAVMNSMDEIRKIIGLKYPME